MILSRLASPTIRRLNTQLIGREASSISDVFSKFVPRHPSSVAITDQPSGNLNTKLGSIRSELESPPRQNKAQEKHRSINKLFRIPVGEMDRPNVKYCRHKIHLFSKDKSSRGATVAQKLLTRLADEASETSEQLLSLLEYNLCLDTWSQSGHVRAFQKCRDLLDDMIARHEKDPEICPAPNTDSYNLVLNACSKASDFRAVKLADEIIRTMEQKSLMNPTGNVHPSTWSYNLVILSHAELAEHHGAASAAEDWLKHLSKRGSEGGPCPDTTSFNCVLKAWSLCQEEKGADRALELLHLMIKLYKEGNTEVKPDVYSASTVINAMSLRKRPEEAEDVLKLALEYLNEQQPPSDMVICFNSTINAWAKSGNPNAPERAYALLRDMQSFSRSNSFANVIVEPDVFTYTSCLEAIVRSGRPDAPEIAEARLYEMIDDSVRRIPGSVAPNRATFDCVIRAWFRSDKINRAERVEELLNLMIKLSRHSRQRMDCFPNQGTVNLCISALCRSRQFESATETLFRMEKLNLTELLSYSIIINALLREEQSDNFENVFQAAHILERMHQQLVAKKIAWPKKAAVYYERVILALVDVGDSKAADLAYNILKALEEIQVHKHIPKSARPSLASYTGVINSLSKVPTRERDHRAQDIFRRIQEYHHDPKSHIRLNSKAYEAILGYYANVREKWAAENACRLLEEMQNKIDDNLDDQPKGKFYFEPTSTCYDKCLQAVARCGDRESTFRAVQLLEMFVQNFKEEKTRFLPSRIGFDSVKKACLVAKDDEAIEWTREIDFIIEDLNRDGHEILSSF